MRIDEIFGGGKELRNTIRTSLGGKAKDSIGSRPDPTSLRNTDVDPEQVDTDRLSREQNKYYLDPKADEKIAKAQTGTKSTKRNNPQRAGKPEVSTDNLEYLGQAVAFFVSEFKKQAKDPGSRTEKTDDQVAYNPKMEIEKVKDGVNQYNLGFRTSNGIAMNIAVNNGQGNIPDKLRINYKNAPVDKQQTVLDAMTEHNIQYAFDGGIPSVKLNNKSIGRTAYEHGDLEKAVANAMMNIWKVTNAVEEMGENFELPSSRKISGVLKRKPSHMRYYIGAALLMYVAVKFRLPNLLYRGGKNGKNNEGIFDVRYQDITVAYSKAGKESVRAGGGRHQEHLVPCSFIQSMAIDMINNHSGEEVIDMKLIFRIADMIKRNLVVAVLSEDEADRLDKGADNLKTTMPENWQDGGNLLARLNAKKIQVFSIDDGTPLNGPF